MSKNRFILLWLCSAAIVILARLLHATDLGYDLTLQIQAAQNLLEGNGVSIYSLGGEDDLAQPNKLVTLTWFPSGYSFFAAALLAIGFSVPAVLKAGGVAGTILGWWGWARLAYLFFREGLECSRVWRWAGTAIAISTPLLFTPPWKSTDIFLWAAVPWVLSWIVRASDEDAPNGRWFDFLAGAVCGFSVLMRYASVFLVAYAGFLIFCQSKLRLKVLARRVGAFSAGLLPLVAVQVYLNYFVSNAEATPGGINFTQGALAAVEHFWVSLSRFTSANFAVMWWMPARVREVLIQPEAPAPWLSGVTFAGLILLPILLAMKLGHRSLTAASRDVRTASVGLFVLVPLFLSACGTLYVGIARYYIPLLPLAVLVAFALALQERSRGSKMKAFIRMTSRAYLAGYLFMAAFGVAFLLMPGERGSIRRRELMGTSKLHSWPSTRVVYEFSAARKYVLALLKDERDTVLVTNMEGWFYADPSVDRSRLHRLKWLRASYISGPARILIIAADPVEGPSHELYWIDVRARAPEAYYFENGFRLQRAYYFEDLPTLRLLKRFPAENVKVLEARVPDGSRIALKRQPGQDASRSNRL